jgi:hypothetical protein
MMDELGKATYYAIVSAKRITRQSSVKETILTPSVLLDFKGAVLPTSVCIYILSMRVEVYVSKPIIYYRYQIVGHIAAQCQSMNPLWGYCAGNYDTREGTNKTENEAPKCVNYQSPHLPSSMVECPVMRHKYEARMQNILQHISFRHHPL